MQKVRFLDSPIEYIVDWLNTIEQKKVRSAINAKYKGKVSEQIYWNDEVIGVDDGLSNDKVERLSQRLILSQMSVLVAQRFFNKFRFLIIPTLFMLNLILLGSFVYNEAVAQNDSATTIIQILSVCGAVFLLLSSNALSAFIFQLFLPNSPINQREIDRIEQTVKDCVINDIQDDTPSDFQDRLRVLDVDRNGRAVAGQILAKDLYRCSLLDEWQSDQVSIRLIGIATLIPFASLHPIIAILAYAYFVYSLNRIDRFMPTEQEQNPAWSFLVRMLKWVGFPMLILYGTTSASISSIFASMSNAPIQINVAVLLFVVAWVSICSRFYKSNNSPINQRSDDLHNAVRQSATELLIDKASRNYFLSISKAKDVQLKNVTNDKTPFIKLGKSTGLLSQRRDHFAPSESGLDFGLSMQDLSTHLLTLGASGTGKTTGVIRPVIHQWLEHDNGGMVVLDGKGSLPKELIGVHDSYNIISPTAEKFNPIYGLTPDAVADSISSVFESSDSKDSFWNDSATLMIRMASFCVHYSQESYTLKSILKFCTSSDEYRKGIINKAIANSSENPHLSVAIDYWLVQFKALADAQRSSILLTVTTWLGNITAHEKLGSWVDVDQGAMIEDVFNGAKIGVLLPSSEYGKGAIVINTIIMRRLYDYAKKRGDSYATHDTHNKTVLLVADEIQNMITQADVENVTIARSLGLYLCYATQNIDGLYNRLDEVSAKQMVGNFASLIAFSTRTKITNEYISQRASKIWKASAEHFDGLPDSQSDFNLHLNNGAYHAHFSHDMYRISYEPEAQTKRSNRAYSLASTSIEETEQGFMENYTREGKPSATVHFGLVPLLEEDEIENILSVPQTAIALINRGRVQRRDVIELDLMGAK